MKTTLSVLFLALLLATPAWARLGETGDEIVARYGQPLSQLNQKGGGKRIPLTELVFQKNGFEIHVSLSDGVSGAESFRKLNGDEFSPLEQRTLLNLNGEGYGWEAPNIDGSDKVWSRDDGGTATLTGGRVLLIKSKALIDKEDAAKVAELAPSLQGF